MDHFCNFGLENLNAPEKRSQQLKNCNACPKAKHARFYKHLRLNAKFVSNIAQDTQNNLDTKLLQITNAQNLEDVAKAQKNFVYCCRNLEKENIWPESHSQDQRVIDDRLCTVGPLLQIYLRYWAIYKSIFQYL